MLLGAGIFGWLRFSSTGARTSPQQLTLTFPRSVFACATDAAWAPDGRRLALLGRDACGTNSPTNSLFRLYDPTSGKQLGAYDLSPIIQAQIVPRTVYAKVVGHARISESDYWFALLLVKASDGAARAVGIAPAPATPPPGRVGSAQPLTVMR
jgi:hypothetical protein